MADGHNPLLLNPTCAPTNPSFPSVLTPPSLNRLQLHWDLSGPIQSLDTADKAESWTQSERLNRGREGKAGDKSGKVNQLVKETNGEIIVCSGSEEGGSYINEAFGNIIKSIIF